MPLFQEMFGGFGKKSFRRLPNSFALGRTTQLETLESWIRKSQSQDNRGKNRPHSILILTHFAKSFLDVQSFLEHAEIGFGILAEPLDEPNFRLEVKRWQETRNPVMLSMVPMLRPTESERSTGSPPLSDGTIQPLAVVCCECHPLLLYDQLLETFLRQSGIPTTINYLLCFEDPLLRYLLGENFIQLMKQLGLGENDLVSSTMTNRQLTRQLQKHQFDAANETKADSIDEWIRINLKQP